MRGLGCDSCQKLSGAPSWYDNMYNEASSSADNIWNDIEAGGVWIGNQASDFWQGFGGSSNPEQYGENLATQVGQGLTNAGTALSSGFNKTLLIGGAIVLAILILDEK